MRRKGEIDSMVGICAINFPAFHSHTYNEESPPAEIRTDGSDERRHRAETNLIVSCVSLKRRVNGGWRAYLV